MVEDLTSDQNRSSRRRSGVELFVLAVAAVAFLVVVPHETVTYVVFGTLGLALVATQARQIRAQCWGTAASPAHVRWRRARTSMVALTALPVFVFLLVAHHEHRPLLTTGFAASIALYIPWAALQQTLFQFYLHGRLRALLRSASPLLPCVLTGLCYGLVHLPDLRLAALTACAGIVWSYCYQRDRYLTPIAASHALLGATFYAWLEGRDALLALLPPIGA